MLFAHFTIVGRNAVAIVGVGTGLALIDQVAHGQGMLLRGAEHQGLLALVDLVHEELHPVGLTLLDLDDPIEIRLGVPLARLRLALHHAVIAGVHVFVQGGGVLPQFERREEAVVDALLQRVDVDRLAEISVGIHVHITLGRGGKAQLHRRAEVFQDGPPCAFVVRATAVAFVDDDEVEEIGRVLPEIRRVARPRHEGLEDGEEHAAVGGHLALLADARRIDAHQGVLGEAAEGVIGLVGQDVAVGEEEDARTPFPVAAQVPAGMEELPRHLEGDRRLARTGGQGEQDALLVARHGIQHALDREVLIVTRLPTPALVLEGDGTEAFPPIRSAALQRGTIGPATIYSSRRCDRWPH